MVKVVLKSGREVPVCAGHPWIFSGAVRRVEGDGRAGEVCRVVSVDGECLGSGFFNPYSSIRVRMLSREDGIDPAALIAARIGRAWDLRERMIGSDTTVYRIVNSEGDFLPGLVVDRFGDGLCIQIHAAGIECFRSCIIESLVRLCSPAFIVDVSLPSFRKREGLAPSRGVVQGILPATVQVRENGLAYAVAVGDGQKTGFYCDQRENRRHVAVYAAQGDVCDCFCYTGGFTCNALAAGARSVTSVDSSRVALELTQCNARLNALSAPRGVCADVFTFLRETQEDFDCIILDPPKFARSGADVQRAARGYKDINLLALRRVRQGGVLATFSCSQAVDAVLFRQIVFAAAADSARTVQIMNLLGHPFDHPVNIAHREGEYLKGLLLRVVS